MHLNAALDRFVLQLQADGRSLHTIAQYRRHVRLLAVALAQAGHTGNLADVDDQDLARFLASPKARTRADGRPKRPGSMNALRSSLRGFFQYCLRADLVERDPSRLIRMAITSPPPPRALRDHEEEKLRAVLGKAEGYEAQRDSVLFELMLATGIRLSSALSIDVDDVDLAGGVIHLRRVKRGAEQRVFLPSGAQRLLSDFIDGHAAGPVFCSGTGERITTRHAQRRFRRWREQAGLPASLTSHGLRHAFAVRLYERTADVLLVSAALGHASVVSTLAYTRATESRVRSALA